MPTFARHSYGTEQVVDALERNQAREDRDRQLGFENALKTKQEERASEEFRLQKEQHQMQLQQMKDQVTEKAYGTMTTYLDLAIKYSDPNAGYGKSGEQVAQSLVKKVNDIRTKIGFEPVDYNALLTSVQTKKKLEVTAMNDVMGFIQGRQHLVARHAIEKYRAQFGPDFGKALESHLEDETALARAKELERYKTDQDIREKKVPSAATAEEKGQLTDTSAIGTINRDYAMGDAKKAGQMIRAYREKRKAGLGPDDALQALLEEQGAQEEFDNLELPEGLTRQDVEYNVKKYGVTPQAVIDEYSRRKK